MPPIDYIVIIVFTILIVMADLSFRKRGSDMKSYFAAGGAVPWPINGLSLYMRFSQQELLWFGIPSKYR